MVFFLIAGHILSCKINALDRFDTGHECCVPVVPRGWERCVCGGWHARGRRRRRHKTAECGRTPLPQQPQCTHSRGKARYMYVHMCVFMCLHTLIFCAICSITDCYSSWKNFIILWGITTCTYIYIYRPTQVISDWQTKASSKIWCKLWDLHPTCSSLDINFLSNSLMHLQLGARKGKGLGAQKLNKSFTEIEQQIEQQQKEQGTILWYLKSLEGSSFNLKTVCIAKSMYSLSCDRELSASLTHTLMHTCIPSHTYCIA